MILISLVGEQPIPNLLPLWQFDKFNAVQFAATATTRAQAEHLNAVIASDPALSRVRALPAITLEAYHLAKARSALVRSIEALRDQGQAICLNFTGGTKIMSLAALQAAYGTGTALMYISTENREVICYQSDGVETSREPLQVKISVSQYLEACGLKVSLPDPRVVPTPKEGDWLEQKVYTAAASSGIFDDVQCNVKVRRTLNDGRMVENELDVVVIRNGRLAVCSCKSGKNVNKETLYELSALSSRENLGIYCGKVLVTALEELPAGLLDRARANHIFILHNPRQEMIGFTLQQATD